MDGGTHGTNVKLLEKKEANKNSSTGIRGVSLSKRDGKYHTYIQFQRRTHALGSYGTIEEAAKAYAEGMEKLQPILDAIKADTAGMKDELVAQAVRTAAELRQAARESRGDAPRSTEFSRENNMNHTGSPVPTDPDAQDPSRDLQKPVII